MLNFLLVPDGAAARRLRGRMAVTAPRMGVIVGPWPALLEQAQQAYLVEGPTVRDAEAFRRALAVQEGAFWSKSYKVAPDETAVEVERALVELLTAMELRASLSVPEPAGLSPRTRRHYEDLRKLLAALDGGLPAELQAIQTLFLADPGAALTKLVVHHYPGFPQLNGWQAALVRKLNDDAGVAPADDLSALLETLCTGQVMRDRERSLQFLQQRLFASDEGKARWDKSSLLWLGVRDPLQEAELAAGIAQRALGHVIESPSRLGLLIPETPEYLAAVKDAFSLAGLTLSGLPAEEPLRDLGREAVFHFVSCRQKPAPAMALAACLSSPLMPWPLEEGAELAQRVMKGDYHLRPLPSTGGQGVRVLNLLRSSNVEPEALSAALGDFVSLLEGGAAHAMHRRRAKAAAQAARDALASAEAIDWEQLLSLLKPEALAGEGAADFNQNGITVWLETQEPWRSVSHLIVFGFAAGHYPAEVRDGAVFSTDDLSEIQSLLGQPVVTATERMQALRARFKRQLAAVSDEVTFFLPRRDGQGKSQAPSESLVFMSELFEGIKGADELIFEMDRRIDRGYVPNLAKVHFHEPTAPRKVRTEDLRFDLDLFTLGAEEDGKLKPESPSSLETLMVSPFAWLLRRLRAEPMNWGPERPDVKLLGTLTHGVFEHLFQAAQPLPDLGTVRAMTWPLLEREIAVNAPFLLRDQWGIERRNLVATVERAALAWREMLLGLNAQIISAEEWLEGHLEGLPLHGQVDAVLGLPEGRLLVVDYKRSRAGNRRPRMEKGFDSQANLYRTMLQTGGPKNHENAELKTRLKAGNAVGVVYYMTQDQTALTDALLSDGDAIARWDYLSGAIADGAMALIRQRITELRAGELYLNREGDRAYFEKYAGITPYALENSPLITRFTLPGPAREVS